MKNQWRGFLCGALASLLLVGMIGAAAATTGKKAVEISYNNISVTLDGAPINLVDVSGNPVEPFMLNNTNYLPVRAVSEALGLNVDWDGDTNTVILNTKQENQLVYITRTGKHWHKDSTCNGGTYWAVPYASAVGMGLTPCDKCVHD